MVKRWQRLPYDGGPQGIGPHWIPPAMAQLTPQDHEEGALLAASIGKALASRRVLVSLSGEQAEAPQSRKPQSRKLESRKKA
jgi:hypothetical protein